MRRFGGVDMKGQKELLHKSFEKWKGVHKQIDDILVVGIRI